MNVARGIWQHRPVRLTLAAVLYALGGWLAWIVAVAILQPPERGVTVIGSFAALWLVVGLLALAAVDTIGLLRAARRDQPQPLPAPYPPGWVNLAVPVAFVGGIFLGHLLWRL